MTEPADGREFDPQAFVDDVVRGAEALGAAHDREATVRILSDFERESREGVIQFRIGSIEGSPVNYRIGCLYDVDWHARAAETGHLPSAVPDDRILRFLPEARQRFPEAVYLGGDFDAARGLEKIYLLFPHPVPFAEFLKIESLPDTFRDRRAALEKHGFEEVVICAADFAKGSINVYFVWHETTAAWLDAFADEWGHGPIPAATNEAILRSAPIHGSVATTWSYAEPGPLRWCVYSIALRYDDPSVYQPGGELERFVLPELLPRFRRFDEVVGTQTDAVAYGLGWSFGRPTAYMKYERSYTKDLLSHYLKQTESVSE